MRKMREPRRGYIDGIVTVYKNKAENRTSFNAVNNAVTMDDLDKIVALRYNIESKRAADVEFAEAHEKTLSLKVSTPLFRRVEALQYAATNDVLYTLYNVDYDDHEDKMYLYMEKVRDLSDG